MLVAIGSLALPDTPIHIISYANHLVLLPAIYRVNYFFPSSMQYTVNSFNCKTFYKRAQFTLMCRHLRPVITDSVLRLTSPHNTQRLTCYIYRYEFQRTIIPYNFELFNRIRLNEPLYSWLIIRSPGITCLSI